MRSPNAFLIAVAATLLAACGPGSDERSAPAATSERARASFERTRALGHSGVESVSVTELLDWAEHSYPQLFPGPQPDLPYGPYTYRYYAGTGNYVGASNGSVYLMGPLAAQLAGDERYRSEVWYFGEVARITCSIHPSRCGHQEVVRLDVGGVPREFIVYVPWKVQQSETRVPAVLMLHGAGEDGAQALASSGWRELADAEGIVAVFPHARVHCQAVDANGDGLVASSELVVGTQWAAGSLGNARPLCNAAQLAGLPPDRRAAADHPLADDIAYLDAVHQHVIDWYPVDLRRVHVAGFDGGGEMSARLALQRSDRFAAFGVGAAALAVAPTPPARLPTVVFSVGSADPTFTTPLGHAQGLPLTAALAAESAWRERIGAPWSTALALAPTPAWSIPLLDGARASRFVYSPTSATATHRFEAWVIEGLGHQYPNGRNHPLALAAQLWSVFRDEVLP